MSVNVAILDNKLETWIVVGLVIWDDLGERDIAGNNFSFNHQ